MLKARRNALSQLFAKELQAAKTVSATQQQSLVKLRVHLPPELAPLYTQMQFEQADPLVQQARHFYIPPKTLLKLATKQSLLNPCKLSWMHFYLTTHNVFYCY